MKHWGKILSLATVVLLCSCSSESLFHSVTSSSLVPKTYTVICHYKDDTDNIRTYEVKDGSLLSYPSMSGISKGFSSVLGWKDESDSSSGYFDFSKPITSNHELYLSWSYDASAFSEWITNTAVTYQVEVESTFYNTFIGIPTDGVVARGTGICLNFQRASNNSQYEYTILTCAHVVNNPGEYSKSKYVAVDSKLVGHDVSLKVSKRNNTYDCAYIQMITDSIIPGLAPIKLFSGSYSFANSPYVASIGHPDSSSPTFSFGQFYSVADVDIVDSSSTYAYQDVFDCRLTGRGGYSGGPLIGPNKQLLGMIFGGTSDEYYTSAFSYNTIRNFVYQYSVPHL